MPANGVAPCCNSLPMVLVGMVLVVSVGMVPVGMVPVVSVAPPQLRETGVGF